MRHKWPKALAGMPACFQPRLLEIAKAKLPAWYVALCLKQGQLKAVGDVVKVIADT